MTCPNPRQRQTRCGAWSSPGPSPRHKSVAAHSDAVDGRPLAASPLQAALGRELGVTPEMLVAPAEQVWDDTVAVLIECSCFTPLGSLRAGDRSSAGSVTEHRPRDLAQVLATSMRPASDELLGA